MGVPFKLVQTADRLVNDIQRNIYNALKLPLSLPQSQGAILTKVALKTGTNTIPHGLGRVPQGWQVVRQRSSATLYDVQDTNPTPSVTLLIVASTNVTVDLFVF